MNNICRVERVKLLWEEIRLDMGDIADAMIAIEKNLRDQEDTDGNCATRVGADAWGLHVVTEGLQDIQSGLQDIQGVISVVLSALRQEGGT